jgi:multidrug efflux pump subunit AcrA (membrane-fusion protein)
MTSRQVMLNPSRDGDEAEEGEGIDGDGQSQTHAPSAAPSQSGPAHPAPTRPGRGKATGDGGNGIHLAGLLLRIIIGLLILGGALAIAAVLVSSRRQALQTPHEETVRRVRVVQAVPRPAEEVARTWQGYGTARARDRADIAAEVSGRVTMRPPHIEPGIAVSAGEVLVQLDDADYREHLQAAQSAAVALTAQLEGTDVEQERLREQVEQATEQVRLLQWEVERLEQARAGAAATELELMRLRASLSRLEGERLRLQQQLDVLPSRRAALRAEVMARRNEAAVAERQLQRTVVVSPIGGVLQTMDANVGEMMQAGQRVARVVDLRRIEVPLRLPARAQGEIRLGDMALVRAGSEGPGDGGRQAGQNGTWQARVARVAPEADPQTRTITVFLEVEQDAPDAGGAVQGLSSLLMPGRFVSAELAAGAGDGQMLLVVPRTAVINDRVWIAVEDERGLMRAQPRQVRIRYHVEARLPELDPQETQWSVIGAGVEPGDRVIVTNLDDLVSGGRVEVVEGAE